MPTYSHSRISTYETCPLQYKYQYLDHIKTKQEDTIECFLGSKVHEVLEKLYKDVMHEKIIPLKELLAYYNKIWKENWNDNIKINKEEYTQENYRKMGIRYITDYYNRHKPFDKGKIMSIEKTSYQVRYQHHWQPINASRVEYLIQPEAGENPVPSLSR